MFGNNTVLFAVVECEGLSGGYEVAGEVTDVVSVVTVVVGQSPHSSGHLALPKASPQGLSRSEQSRGTIWSMQELGSGSWSQSLQVLAQKKMPTAVEQESVRSGQLTAGCWSSHGLGIAAWRDHTDLAP